MNPYSRALPYARGFYMKRVGAPGDPVLPDVPPGPGPVLPGGVPVNPLPSPPLPPGYQIPPGSFPAQPEPSGSKALLVLLAIGAIGAYLQLAKRPFGFARAA